MKKKIIAWEKYPATENCSQNYYFSEYALQLNIPPEFYPGLVKTDSRFRPDQRALENGDISLAVEEKLRLEKKQREARKTREESKEDYFPRWFHHTNGDWAYKGGYWEAKESISFTSVLDIF